MRAKVRHFRLSQLSTLNSQRASPSARLHRISRSTGILPVGPTDILSVASVTASYKPAGPEPNDWPMGSRIPVTAAQLLPIHTGFLAPIHFFKLAKNCLEK